MEKQLSKKEQKKIKLQKIIKDNISTDLVTSVRTLCVETYNTLNNIQTDVKFFKSESIQLINRMYSYARLYVIEEDDSYLNKFRLKLEDLRSNFRMMFELNLILGGSSFKMCEAFARVDEEFEKLFNLNH